jgi:hypothetical protein
MKVSPPTRLDIKLYLTLLMTLISCHKAEEKTPYQVTESDAAGIIANNLLPPYGRFLNQVNNCLAVRQTGMKFCGQALDSTLSGTNQPSANIIYQYNLLWHYNYDCSKHTFNISYSGPYTDQGAVYISADQSSASLVLSEPSAGLGQLNGSQQRSGSQRIKMVGNNSFNSTVTIKADGLMIDLVSKNILSGNAKVAMNGTSGSDFNFAGTVTFSGGNKANMILNSGKVYHLNW